MNWIASLSDAERWAIGLAVVLFLGLAAHRLVLSRDYRSVKEKAADDFRSTFYTELKGLYPNPIAWPRQIDSVLIEKLPRLQSAVARFKEFIPSEQHADFDAAWDRYCGFCRTEINDNLCRAAVMYSYHGSDPKAAFRKHVDELLEFSRQT